ncbi:MAG TPA: prepilin-type N-terminal cleavage/methylation domain-containing protein [Candidatus Saccharimonadales bacterium]|nr:prepilin-type N-terminal cleavage/methylation domain-containing protein [Candidatus Saccharimonadales bacterium]
MGWQTANSKQNQDGFTIVELMIATVVFSLVLLVITMGVLHFSNSYYKGVNSSATQQAAQNAIDTISQSLQFGSAGSAGTDVAPAGAFCAGSEIFIYTLGKVYPGGTPTGSNSGLYESSNTNAGTCDPASVTNFTIGNELLGPKMRITNVSVINTDPSSNLWDVSLTVAYGDADLLCNTKLAAGVKGSCNNSSPRYALGDLVTGNDVACHTDAGSQFCSVAKLETIAQQRVTGS